MRPSMHRVGLIILCLVASACSPIDRESDTGSVPGSAPSTDLTLAAVVDGDSWSVKECVFSPDAKFLVFGNEYGIWCYDIRTTTKRKLELGDKSGTETTPFAMSSSGQLIAIPKRGNLIDIRRLPGGEQVRTLDVGSTSFTDALAFADHDKSLLVCYSFFDPIHLSHGSKLVRITLDSGKSVNLDSCNGMMHAVIVSPDQSTIVVACNPLMLDLYRGDAELRFLSSSGHALAKLQTHEGWIEAAAFSPDGTLIACSTERGDLTVWKVTTKQKSAVIRTSPRVSALLAFSPKSDYVAAADYRQIVLFHPGDQKKSQFPEPNAVSILAFSPDAGLIATGRPGGGLSIWRVAGDWATPASN